MMTQEQIEMLLTELRNVSHGGQSGPLGLEAVAMALGGEGSPGHDSVAGGLHDIASALREVAEAINTSGQ